MVNYSLLVMETDRMMKMAFGDDFPLRQGAREGLQMRSLRYRGLRWWCGSSRILSGRSYIYRSFWRRFHVRGPTRDRQAQGARPRGWARPPGLWLPWPPP